MSTQVLGILMDQQYGIKFHTVLYNGLDVILRENQWLCCQRNLGCFLWAFDKQLIGKKHLYDHYVTVFYSFIFSMSFIEVLLMRK